MPDIGQFDVVTGAFGYIGRYITAELLQRGRAVRTITTHPHKPNPFGEAVQAFSYSFDQPERLIQTLQGASTLYTTYWVRFEHGGITFRQAVENTRTLFDCARQAGVNKIVHVSVTNPSVESTLPYYRGKAEQEKALIENGLPYSIIRPTLVFGIEDILVNNIIWLMRKFPLFPVFGDGSYRVQPVFVGDLATLAADHGASPGNETLDAIGPETYSFEEFLQLIASFIKPGIRLVHLPPRLGIGVGKLIGFFVRDVILTQDELTGLMASLLTSTQPPNGKTPFAEWLRKNRALLGKAYSSELQRHFPIN